MFLQLASHQQVKFLVSAAQFDIRLECHRVIALHQRIDEFVDRDGLVALVAFGKIIALQHLRDGVRSRQLDQIHRAEFVHPGRVEHDLGFFRIQHLEYLVAIGLCVFHHLLTRQGRTRGIFAARVADHPGEVTDQKQRVMAEILQLAHLV